VILVAGATGELGGRVVRLLREREAGVRALVRPASAASGGELERIGVEVARGDLRDPVSLDAACAGVTTVVSTATAISRILAGERTSLASVDGAGTQDLIAAAEAAGVQRFVFVSYAGLDEAPGSPLDRAKRAGEQHLARSPLQSVVVRPEPFQELWLAPVTGLDWSAGKLTIYGRGDNPVPYIATENVAALLADLALADDTPRLIQVGGPERLTRNEVANAGERLTGRTMKRRHVPRAVLRLGSKALARPRPALASLMGLSLLVDTVPSRSSDAPLLERGIEPRAATDFLLQLLAPGQEPRPQRSQ
jgi:uncharacterized protein YbjT (DUF2867 family)